MTKEKLTELIGEVLTNKKTVQEVVDRIYREIQELEKQSELSLNITNFWLT